MTDRDDQLDPQRPDADLPEGGEPQAAPGEGGRPPGEPGEAGAVPVDAGADPSTGAGASGDGAASDDEVVGEAAASGEAADADADADAVADADAEEPLAASASGAATASAADAATRTRRRRKPVGSTAVKRMRRSGAAERRRRTVISAVNRTIGTLAGLGILGASVWALGWMPLPEVGIEPQADVIRPAAGDQVRVCAGPLMQMGLTNIAGDASAVGEPDLRLPDGSSADVADLGEATGPQIVTVDADGEPVAASAAQSLEVATNRTAGFTATACIQPAPSQWLMAGSTTLGHSLVLDVVNPGAAPARVNFSVHTERGHVAPGIPEMVLEPGTRQQVSLAGIAPDAEALAVEVTATGSPVAAFLHEAITATLDPVGLEIVAPTALPATAQTLPGLYIAERAGHVHDHGGGPEVPDVGERADRGTSVRLLNPGAEPTTTDLRVVTATGDEVEHYRFDLPAGVVVDVVLSGLPTGEYTVLVEADEPVVAGARTGPIEPSEYAWLAAPAPLGDDETVVVPAGGSPRLAIANPGDAPVTVRVDGRDVEVGAGTSASVDVSAGTVTLEGAAGLVAALHWDEPGGFASMPVLTGNADSEPVTVYP
ncbi:MAG: hypothetical protein GXX90_07755 [Microbacteriaceae bacterium]|nr:hypothetical protein [Microbacteriaceae bacterium]